MSSGAPRDKTRGVEVLGATTNELLFVLFLLGLVLVGTKAGDLGEALFRLWSRR